VYLCRPAVHVARSLDALEGFLETLVLEHLAANDIGGGLRQSERQVDLGPLRTNRAALVAWLEELGELFAAGAIDASQLRRGSGDLCTQIAGIDTVLAPYTSPLTALALSVDEDTTLEDHWVAASVDIQGNAIAELMDVVVMPAPRGARRLDSGLIAIR
jgi:site-specific DNA recombinase